MATEVSIMAVIRAARPQFRGTFDKAAFAVHAAFVSAGYVLHATGLPAFADDALSRASGDEVGMDKWNVIEGNFAFVYSNPYKDSKKVLVKCFAMGPYLVVDALKEGEGSQLLHIQLNASEYVNENGGANYGSKFKNLGKMVEKFNSEILNKLDVDTSPASAPVKLAGRGGESTTNVLWVDEFNYFWDPTLEPDDVNEFNLMKVFAS